MLTEVSDSAHLVGVKFSVNQEADDLSHYFGLEFRNIPDKVYLSFYNRLAILAQIARPSVISNALKLNVQLFRPNLLGLYVPDFHAYITKTDDPIVGRHENTHAYIDEKNPHIRKDSEVIMSRFKYILKGEESQDLNIEQAVVYRCLNEGLSQWIAIQIGLQSGDSGQVEIATKYHNKLMANHEDGRKLTNSTTHALKMFGELRKSTQAISQELEASKNYIRSIGGLTSPNKGRIMVDATRRNFRVVLPNRLVISDAAYRVGYYFTDQFMTDSRRKDLSYAEATELVLTKPPSKLEELRKPSGYLTKLLR